jgi:hypothetical protein
LSVDPLPAQSDDLYERIGFRRLADGVEASGTVGWREGLDNRVAFKVWDGPSFSAGGETLATALSDALRGIRGEGYLPLIAAVLANPPAAPQNGLKPLDAAGFDRVSEMPEPRDAGDRPRFQPVLWLLVVLVLLAILWPVLTRAELPLAGRTVPFPNAPYLWRYDGPEFDPSSASEVSIVRLRALAKEAGDTHATFDPTISILDGPSETVIARYVIAGGSFCDYEDDNCEMDGIFPVILAGTPQEPVLAAVTHVGDQGQKLSVFRPLHNPSAAVFEATADYAVRVSPLPGGLFAETERADSAGNLHRDMQMWVDGSDSACTAAPVTALPDPPHPSAHAAALENDLRRIARNRDLPAFVDRLTDDVLVSFGGNGGRQEFLSSLDRDGGEATFWDTLDRLLAQGGWNGADDPEMVTWPWYFAAWPAEDDGYDAYLGGPGLTLRAGPDERAPVLQTLGFGVLRLFAPEPEEDAIDWHSFGWLPVATPGFCLGYVRADQVTPLLGTRMIARREGGEWKIEAFVAGD